jgi:CHAT domain-containing protein
VEALAALWQVLVPAAEREALTTGKLKRLVVVPDGPLAMLPFDALVVEDTVAPEYLLDVGPPIVYAPSATFLNNLTRQTVSDERRKVLSVGDANYGGGGKDADRGGTFLTARARIGSLHGALQPLPHTATECKEVAGVFKKAGFTAGTLRKDSAREASVRKYAPGQGILHFACHGLVDQSYGNLFGALALTPGPQGSADPTDDGFLTLAEIYSLPLAGTELSILSACETNLGPQQRGEGTWSLSRGFMVAGSRRVVASNWLVDDEAAASLVREFCSSVAEGRKAGTVDYADALQKAKRWTRNQDKWSRPFFWGTFVLLGPN